MDETIEKKEKKGERKPLKAQLVESITGWAESMDAAAEEKRQECECGAAEAGAAEDLRDLAKKVTALPDDDLRLRRIEAALAAEESEVGDLAEETLGVDGWPDEWRVPDCDDLLERLAEDWDVTEEEDEKEQPA